MARTNSTLKIVLYLVSALALVAGLAGAAVAYEKAIDDEMKDVIGFQMVGGKAYPILPQDTKRYAYDLERFGGKFAILADKLNRWFAGLWRGKNLSYMLALFSIGVSFVCFSIARDLPIHAAHD
jgi:hypothetical protein